MLSPLVAIDQSPPWHIAMPSGGGIHSIMNVHSRAVQVRSAMRRSTDIRACRSAIRRQAALPSAQAVGLGCAIGRHSPRSGLPPMTPEFLTSGFGWDSHIQIRSILRTSRGEEVGTEGFGDLRFSPKAEVCVRFHVDPGRSCTSSLSKTEIIEDVSLNHTILHDHECGGSETTDARPSIFLRRNIGNGSVVRTPQFLGHSRKANIK
jgi:hypothetical protein